MATIEALQPRLRQLKLSGMVDSIAARVQEARARPLDRLDFLLLLLEDELMRRESESIDRYIHRAHFDEVCDLRDFDFAYNPEVPKAPHLGAGQWPLRRGARLNSAVRPDRRRKDVHRSGAWGPDLPTTPSRRVHQDQRLPGRWLAVAPKGTGKHGCAAISRPTW